MRYRILPPEEWDLLIPLIAPEFLPSREAATAAVAEDEDGMILGVLFLQLQLHMEPLLLLSHQVSFKRLQETLDDSIKDRKGLVYFAFTDNPRIARMAELCGMEPVPMQIWRKEIR